MARALITNGAMKVYILGRRLEVLEAAARENPGLIAIRCDVTSKDSLQEAVDKITADSGFINLLIANSGVGGPPNRWNLDLSVGEQRKVLFTDTSMEDFTGAMGVNVTGALFTMTAFLELLDAGNKNALNGGFGGPGLGIGGRIPAVQSQVIVTSSLAAFSRMSMSAPAYACSKAAVMHITKQASSMLGKYGIRANSLNPGREYYYHSSSFCVAREAHIGKVFPSELAASMIGNRKPELELHGDPKFIPARRFGGEQEMAGTILYLASRAGSYCNGLMLLIDGGRASQMTSSY